MRAKRKTYSADFKAKLVLEVLEGKKTINEIASKYEILPKNNTFVNSLFTLTEKLENAYLVRRIMVT